MLAEPEPSPTCAECGGRGWVVVADGKSGAARLCECRKQERLPRLVTAAGVPPRYRECRLANFRVNVKGAETQLLAARSLAGRYVESFLTESGQFREGGLLFIGPPGVGKTHLAVAVLLELIQRYGVRGKFVDFTSLLNQIQSTFDAQSPDSKQAVLLPVLDAEVLVLDELGAQKPSEWVRDTLYLILNHRYTRRLPTIFTTNYRLPSPAKATQLDRGRDRAEPELLETRLPAALLSRLYEMAQPVVIESEDFRQKVLMHSRHL
jgi:DNA replication protein DnaC